MLPIIFDIGPVAIRSFGLFLTVGYLLGTFFVWREGKRQGYNEEKLLDLCILILIGALVGARLYFVAFHYEAFRDDFLRIFAIWSGGLSFHGSILGGLLALYLYTKRRKWPFFQVADIIATAATLAFVIGRIGSFLAGTEIGIETSLPFGVKFIGEIGRRHPTQLYEAALGLATFFVLKKIDKVKNKSGVTFLSAVIFIEIIRFLVEFLRAESTYFLNFKIDQVLALLLAIVGLIALYLQRERNLKGDFQVLTTIFNNKFLRRKS